MLLIEIPSSPKLLYFFGDHARSLPLVFGRDLIIKLALTILSILMEKETVVFVEYGFLFSFGILECGIL